MATTGISKNATVVAQHVRPPLWQDWKPSGSLPQNICHCLVLIACWNILMVARQHEQRVSIRAEIGIIVEPALSDWQGEKHCYGYHGNEVKSALTASLVGSL